MKKSSLLFLATLLPCFAHAALYVEPRVSYVHIGNLATDSLDPIVKADSYDITGSIAVGYEINRYISAEFRYTAFKGINIRHRSTGIKYNFAWLEVAAPYEKLTKLEHESDLGTLAIPIRILNLGKFSAQLTPLLNVERAETVSSSTSRYLNEPATIIIYFPTAPHIRGRPPIEVTVANPPTEIEIHKRTDHRFSVGGELNLAYELSKRVEATLSYSYMSLKNFDAHFVSTGVRIKF